MKYLAYNSSKIFHVPLISKTALILWKDKEDICVEKVENRKKHRMKGLIENHKYDKKVKVEFHPLSSL